MGHAGNERCDIGLGDGIGDARCAIADDAWTPVLGEGICQGRIDQFERGAKTVLGRVPFPALVGIHNGAHAPDGPIAVVGKLYLVNQSSARIFESHVMADCSRPTGHKVEDAWILVGEGGAIGGDNQIGARSECGIRGKGKLDAFGETPTGNVSGNIVCVSQFDVAFEQIAGSGVIHDFIDDNAAESRSGGEEERGCNDERPKRIKAWDFYLTF